MADAAFRIPPNFSRLLDQSDLGPRVREFANRVAVVLDDNKTPFFPHYTNHGRAHIEAVLSTQERLVPNDVWDKLKPEDAAVAIAAGLLHDIGMHVRESGFISLVGGDSTLRVADWFREDRDHAPPDKDWPSAWNEYMREARAWGDREIISRIGPNALGRWNPSRFQLSSNSWTQADHLFIGEFIRKGCRIPWRAPCSHSLPLNDLAMQ